MARTRSIKPGISKNEHLGDLSHSHRLLYTWSFMLADREGRFEFRPKRIKAELFPYDDYVSQSDIDQWCHDLEKSGFYVIYDDGQGGQVVQINNFVFHQNPHKNEAPSSLPPPPSGKTNGKAKPNIDELPEGSRNVEKLPEGSRNSTLFSEYCSLDTGNGNREVILTSARAREPAPGPSLSENPHTEKIKIPWGEVPDRLQEEAKSALAEKGVDVADLAARFVLHYRGTGEARENWPAVWHKWVLSEKPQRTRWTANARPGNGAKPDYSKGATDLTAFNPVWMQGETLQ